MEQFISFLLEIEGLPSSSQGQLFVYFWMGESPGLSFREFLVFFPRGYPFPFFPPAFSPKFFFPFF